MSSPGLWPPATQPASTSPDGGLLALLTAQLCRVQPWREAAKGLP